MYKHILVAVDGSDTSNLALQEAIKLAKEQQAELHLIHVVDETPAYMMVETPYPVADLQKAMREAGQKVLAICAASGEIGDAIHLRDIASKGRSGRVVPLNRELKRALIELRASAPRGRPSPYVITTERSTATSAHVIVLMFAKWFRALGYHGCSSHSGRRTFITNAARKISTVGGSLRDIQVLAGHTSLSTTQRYIESDAAAQRKIVELV